MLLRLTKGRHILFILFFLQRLCDWDWDLMADSHVYRGVLVLQRLLLFRGSFNGKRHKDDNFIIPFKSTKSSSWRHHLEKLKFPIVKISKHGATVLALPLHNDCLCTLLLSCGDIHPQPGPSLSNTSQQSISRSTRTLYSLTQLKQIGLSSTPSWNSLSRSLRESLAQNEILCSSNRHDVRGWTTQLIPTRITQIRRKPNYSGKKNLPKMRNSSNCIIISPVHWCGNSNNSESNNHHASLTAKQKPIPTRIMQLNIFRNQARNSLSRPALHLIKPTNTTAQNLPPNLNYQAFCKQM